MQEMLMVFKMDEHSYQGPNLRRVVVNHIIFRKQKKIEGGMKQRVSNWNECKNKFMAHSRSLSLCRFK
jgi:hypothetical protein